ncbi:MAG: transposase [Leptolyngbya sp. PLA2]|nr:transposase [Leptolyngbya sp. PL-A2]MCQ3940453.1 hypothetical protein [cyanobacterium CYA1]MDL1904302.1 transposase [Synechococcales cyanobacterium CNB]GIK19533.1 MAG: hypothetical protein BroJett004_16970 [Planctomycetota bacterium]
MTMKLANEQLDWTCDRIPDAPRSPLGGRPPTDKRKAVAGDFWILDNGAKWKDLPRGFGSKSAVHRCFKRWVEAGVFENIMQDGRALRRYKRRLTMERTIEWFQHFRRLCIRWEKTTMLFQGYLHFACSIILLREVMG